MSKPNLITLLSTPYANEGIRLFENGHHAHALESFDKAVYLSECYHHFYHYQGSFQYCLLAESHHQLGEWDEAATAYEKSLFQDHTNARALEGVAQLISRDMALLSENYTRMVEYDHDIPTLIYLPGQKPVHKEKTQQRLRENKTPSGLYDLGIWYFLQGDHENARVAFAECLREDASHSKAVFAMGRIAHTHQQWRDAVAWLRHAARLLAEEHDGYHWTASHHRYMRAGLHMAMNALDMAIADYTKALELQNKNKQAYLARAECYLAKGNVALAEADMRHAKRL